MVVVAILTHMQLHNDRLPKLVVLSACHSESVGRGFVAAGVPHVIAVTASSPINDGVAILFMHSFYRQLFVCVDRHVGVFHTSHTHTHTATFCLHSKHYMML